MKTNHLSPPARRARKTSRALAGSIAAMLAVSSAHAAIVTWNAGTAPSTNGLWATATNWTADTAPSNGSDLVFDGTAFQTNSNGGWLTSVGSVTLNNPGWNIGLSGVTINGGGLAANGTSTVVGLITLGAAQTWSNSVGLLTVSGVMSKGGNLLTVGGAGDTAISASIVGPGGLTKQDAGTLTLSASNTYSGTTTLTAGTLNVGATANLGAAAANVVFDGGTLRITGTTLANFTGLGHTVSFNATKTVGLDINSSSHTFTVDQVLNQTTGGFTKLGAGTVVLNQANTYTGNTLVTAGTLRAGAAGGGQVFGNSSAVTMSNVANAILDLNSFNQTIGSLAGGGATGGNVTLGTATLTTGGNNTSTSYAGVIGVGGATGGLTKTGTGTQTLTGLNTYSGATTVNAGTLILSGNRTATATGGFNVGNVTGVTGTLNVTNGTFTVGTTGSNFRVGSVDGTGILNQSGGSLTTTGNQLLIGNGTATGTYNLSAGTLTTVAGTLGVTVGVNTGATGTFNLSGTGMLTMPANSTLQIGRSDNTASPFATNTTGTFTQTGGTATVGILQMGGGATTPTNNAGTNSTLTLTGGTFAATTFNVLSGGNTSTSTITIGGSAQVTLPVFPTNTKGTLSTAYLTFDSTTGFLSPVAASTTYMPAGTFTKAYLTANGAKFNVPTAKDITIAQVLEDAVSPAAAGTLTKTGTGTLTLSGANTYTGVTNVNAGIVRISNATSLGTTAGNTVIADGAKVFVTTTGLTVNEAFNISDIGGIGAIHTGGNATVGFSGGITLSAAAGIRTDGGSTSTFSGGIDTAGNILTFNGSGNAAVSTTGISGVGGWVVKTSTGTLTLSAASTYTGGTSIDGGIINVTTNAGALGSGTVTFNGGTRLVVATGLNVTNAITIGPSVGVPGRGLVEAGTTAGIATVSGPITINNPTTAGGHFGAPTAGTVLHVAGTITSSVGIGSRIGTVMFSGGGTGYTNLSVQQGAVMVGATNGIATTATVRIGTAGAGVYSAGGTLDLNGFNQSLVGITKGTFAATIGNSSTTTDSTLTTTGTSTYDGVIQDVISPGTKKVNLTVNGGALTLTGANTFSGQLSVPNGTLSIGTINNASASGPLGSSALAVILGNTGAQTGILQYTGGSATSTKKFTLATGGTGVFDVTTGATALNLSGVIDGSGGLTKSNTGTLTLNGTNTYTGGTTVSGGRLIMTKASNLGNGALDVGGNTFIYAPTAAGTLNIGSGVLTLTNGSTIGTALGGTASQSAITSTGVAGLSGTGTVNIYGISGVAPTLGSNDLITASSGLDSGTYTLGAVFNNANFTVSNFNRATGTAISVDVTAATALSGNVLWKGGLTGNAGVWAASNGSTQSNWQVTDGVDQPLAPGATADLVFSTATAPGTMSGMTLGANMTVRTLTINDTATAFGLEADGFPLTLTPASSTTGLTMGAGVLAGTIGANVTLGAAQTWTNNSTNPLTVSGAVSGAFALTKAGPGTLTLSGINTYTGATTINASSGTLDISGAGKLGNGSYAGAIAIGTGSTFRYSNNVSVSTQTLSGAITGQGALTMDSTASDANLTLSNVGNTYSGPTTIGSGRIQVSPVAGLSPNTTFVITGNATSGGQLFLNASGTVNNSFFIAGVGYVEADGLSTRAGAIRLANNDILTGAITLTGDARIGYIASTSFSSTLSGQITGSFGIEFFAGLNGNGVTHGFGLANIGTANDYTGNTVITAEDFSFLRTGGRATVTLGASDQIPNGPGKGIVVFSGANTDHISILGLNGFSETINGVSNVSAAGAIIRNLTTGASVLTIGDADTSSAFSGVITDGGIGKTLAITKIGTGTLTLSGANTYIGATTVSAGTLAVNGSLGNSAVAVGNTGRLQGSGSIGGSVTVQSDGIIAAGNSIESLATGTLNLNAGSTFAYEINSDAAPGVAGDLTAVTGDLTLDPSNAANLVLAELGAGTWTAGEKLTLISYSGTWSGGLFNYGGSLADDSVFNFSGMDWLFDYNDTAAGSNFTGDLTGASFVTMTATPEPGVAALLAGMGALALLRRRRA